jgi:hypothetical protein
MNNIVAITSDDLKVGMTVVRFDDQNKMIIDAHLKELIPGTRGCRGLHFFTSKKTNVCYLPGGKVQILA